MVKEPYFNQAMMSLSETGANTVRNYKKPEGREI